MHLRTLGYLVDCLLVIADCNANKVQVVRSVCSDGSAICGVMAGFEHVFDIDCYINATGKGARLDFL